jgi:hypothetical protein
LLRLHNRKRAQENRVDQREDRGVDADADRQRRDGAMVNAGLDASARKA